MGRNKKEIKVNRFDIDFFEFSFLVEACIPPRPIARTSFWYDLINKHYHVLTENERERLHEWIGRCNNFDINEENCKLFDARFDPNNQYIIKTLFKDEENEFECFKLNERYYTKKDTFISEEYIKEIIKK